MVQSLIQTKTLGRLWFATPVDCPRGWYWIWNLPELSRVSTSVAVFAWLQSSAIRKTSCAARQTGFGAGLHRGLAVVLAVAGVVCWLGKPGASPVAPPTAARVAAGAALAERSPRSFGTEHGRGGELP
jgi:hypothetical protein